MIIYQGAILQIVAIAGPEAECRTRSREGNRLASTVPRVWHGIAYKTR